MAIRHGRSDPPGEWIMLRLVRQIGVACLVAGAFFATFRELRMGQVNFLLSDLFFVMAVPCLLVSLRTRSLLPFDGSRLRIAWYLGALLLTLGLTLSTVINGDPLRGLIVVGQYLFALLVLPALLAAAPAWSRRSIGVSYLVGIGAVAAYGVVLYFLFPLQARVYTFGGRMASLLGDPNAFSKVIGISVPLLFAMIVRQEIPRALGMVVGAAFLGGVLVAASFSGLAANLVAVILFFALLGRTKEMVRLGAVLLVLGSAYFYAFGVPDIVERRILPVLVARDLSAAPNFDSRLSGVTEALSLVRSPLVGVGADDFRLMSNMGKTAHNTVVLLQVEGGAGASVGWMICIFVMLWASWSAWRTRDRDRVWGAAGVATASAIFVAALANSHMYSRFWYVAAFILLNQMGHEGPAGSPEPVPERAREPALAGPRGPAPAASPDPDVAEPPEPEPEEA